MYVLRAISLFSGIGGLDLAAHAVGIETEVFSEIEPYAVKILEKRWPDVENVGDITRFTNRTLRELGGSPYHTFKTPADAGEIDLVHGGFPCQDLSIAGKRAGLSGGRSGLWFEMLRVVSESRPRWVIAENVRGAVNLALDTVQAGLEEEGYQVWPHLVSASAFGAPHKRERLFVVACRGDVADSLSGRLSKARPREQAAGVAGEDTCCSVADSDKTGLQGRQVARGIREVREEPGDEFSGRSSEADGALWPTPQQRDYRSGDEPDSIRATRKRELGWSINLNDAVKLWPTPTAHGNYNKAGLSERSGNGLSSAVSLWPTPRANKVSGYSSEGYGKTLPQSVDEEEAALWRTPDANASRGPSSEERYAWKKEKGMPISINDQVKHEGNAGQSGQLSPDWVETLMGFPLGWTDLECEEPEMLPWPALMGQDQYPWEPPRTGVKIPERAKRLKALGNAVVPAQALAFFLAIAEMEQFLRGLEAGKEKE